MAEKMRLNKVIDLLQRGQPVFSYGTVMNGNFDELMAISRADYDMAIIETEHQGTPPMSGRSIPMANSCSWALSKMCEASTTGAISCARSKASGRCGPDRATSRCPWVSVAMQRILM